MFICSYYIVNTLIVFTAFASTWSMNRCRQLTGWAQWQHVSVVTGPRAPSAALSVTSPHPRLQVLLRATPLNHRELSSPVFQGGLSITCLDLNTPLYFLDPVSEGTKSCLL